MDPYNPLLQPSIQSTKTAQEMSLFDRLVQRACQALGWVAAAVALAILLAGPAQADRVKDLASAASMRSNQLLGYGLVVGLEGTGDGADVSVTASSMKAMLGRLGVNIDGSLGDFDTASGGKLDVKNVAAVMVTAELPGFAKPGQKIDVNVSAIGKAKSLRGGTLILTSLRGVDGQVYA
ncbi:MAG: flagellar basal body P-ring protein FlgI, partial [Burkholderiaceae bacterium]